MPETPDWYLQRRLNDALRRQRIDQVEALLNEGADAKWHPPEGDVNNLPPPPIFAAVRANFIPGLELLHSAGADMNAASALTDTTPLMLAASNEDAVETGRWLMRHGADHRRMNRFSVNALSMALTYRKIDFADMLLEEDARCRSDLLPAVAKRIIDRRDFSVAQWLLQQGISPNLIGHEGKSWLSVTQSSSPDETLPLIDLLLHAGADVNLVDERGNTPLHSAFEYKVIRPIMRLLQAGADPSRKNKYGMTFERLMETLGGHQELCSAYAAWKASCSAHQAVTQATQPVVRPL